MLNFINAFLKKSDTTGTDQSEEEKDSIKTIKNWYEEKYDTVVVQRNILFLLSILFLALVFVSIIAVVFVVNAKKYDPFVIQVDENTGTTKIVTPSTTELMTSNDAIARYFIKRYIIARETYNPVDFETLARKTVRLCSNQEIYEQYLGYIKNKAIDPSLQYGTRNTTFLVVKSWSKLDKNRYLMRFSINETNTPKKIYNKIAMVQFEYVAMELKGDEDDINPIGFLVTGYRVDDDNS